MSRKSLSAQSLYFASMNKVSPRREPARSRKPDVRPFPESMISQENAENLDEVVAVERVGTRRGVETVLATSGRALSSPGAGDIFGEEGASRQIGAAPSLSDYDKM